MSPALRLVLVALAIASSGCTRWERPSALPAPRDAPVALRAARLTRQSGMMQVLHDVRITADSVTGWGEGAPDPSGLLRGLRRRVSLHRGEVLALEPAVRDRWATAGAAVLGVLAAYGLVALYFTSTAAI
jgi:hypothetical protein